MKALTCQAKGERHGIDTRRTDAGSRTGLLRTCHISKASTTGSVAQASAGRQPPGRRPASGTAIPDDRAAAAHIAATQAPVIAVTRAEGALSRTIAGSNTFA
nr:hypothetical protein [Nocardia arthritidis]